MAAKRLNMVVFMLVVVAALLQSSAAQTTHVVGDELGWRVPPGGPIAYSTWAAQQTFTVGDILVFNFTTGDHDVAQVSKAAFDACDSTSNVYMSTTGPTNITLNSTGEHYYICTFSRHCGLGQKLAINVSAATAPAPQAPTTPSPPRAPETYVVLDTLGWIVPPGGPIAYEAWAYNKTFMTGDTLVFNFTTGDHDVAEVTRMAFDDCNSTNPISISTTGPTNITLSTAGEHYYICTFTRHCGLGQKLAINVSTASAPTPQAPTTPPPASAPTPTTSNVPAPTPAPSAYPPSPTASPPTPTASPPSPTASPPSPTASPPSPTTSTPPTPTATPPPATTPSTPSPSGSVTPPPPSSSASIAAAALPVTLLSIVVALLY